MKMLVFLILLFVYCVLRGTRYARLPFIYAFLGVSCAFAILG